MTNVSKSLRGKLAENWFIRPPEIHTVKTSRDGTIKFLLRLEDDCLVESVLIPEQEKMTQCLSSQVGCPMACTFCSTGQMGFVRNMRAGEIAGQILTAREYLKKHLPEKRLTNFVFMGMGDPLLNWEEMEKALKILHYPDGLAISKRRITVSSVGFPGMIARLGGSDLALLAVSLHAPTQELRKELMPRAANFELGDLLTELKNFPLRPRERITIEYLLIKDKNDSPHMARQLAKLLSGLKCKVNLIAYNPAGDKDIYRRPEEEQVLTFEKILWSKGLTATLRKSKGLDINAACGQLKVETTPGE
jgi:23S rRNA (adenine2503-C2)-methyltransferase